MPITLSANGGTIAPYSSEYGLIFVVFQDRYQALGFILLQKVNVVYHGYWEVSVVIGLENPF